MYFIAVSDQRTMGVVLTFGLKASKIIFVVLLNPCKCERPAPLPIDWRSEKQELVEKVTLQSELWLSAMNRGPTRDLLPMHMDEWESLPTQEAQLNFCLLVQLLQKQVH